jgi:RNA polymerase sigma factor (sigma-70 family)
MSEDSDSELMRRVRGGRTSALATLFERHHTRLYRYCLRMTGNRQTSEDLVQDVFMKMLKHKAQFRDDSVFMPWMYGIARNACAMYWRRAALHPVAESDLDSLPAEPQADDDHAGAQQADLMRRALLQLPAARREVLVLSRYEFQTYEEIAHALGCSVSAVKVRAHRALKQLGDIYRDLTGEVPT